MKSDILEVFLPRQEVFEKAISRDGGKFLNLHFFSVFLMIFLIKDAVKYRRLRAEQPLWLEGLLPEDPESFYRGLYKRTRKADRPFDIKKGVFSAWKRFCSSAELSMVIRDYRLDRKGYARLARKYPMIPEDPSVFSDWPEKLGYGPDEAWDSFLGREPEAVVIDDELLEKELSLKELVAEVAADEKGFSDIF